MANSFDSQSRLIYLVYQVLTTLTLPVEGKTDAEVFAMLAQAFNEKASITEIEAVKRRQGGKPVLFEMYRRDLKD